MSVVVAEAPQRRGIGLEPDQFLAFVPARLTHRQSGPQQVVGKNPIPDVGADHDEDRSVWRHLGCKGRHPIHSEVRVVLFGDAFIVPSPLLSIRWAGHNQTYRLILKGWDDIKAVAMKDGTATFLDSHRS